MREQARARPATSVRRLRLQRAAAATAVAACLVANVWVVARASNESGASGALAAIGKVSTEVGLRSKGPAAPSAAKKPAPPRVVERGSGTLTPVTIPGDALTTADTGRPVRISIEAEGGLEVDPAEFATMVAQTLTDPRGWQQVDDVRFVAVSPEEIQGGAQVDLRIALASPDTTDRLCAPLQTRGQVSCHNGGRAVINLRRWQLGVAAYGSDLAAYRSYLVNHEVGHGLGHGHDYCGGPGQVAPVMMQQTYGLKGCTAWPWPAAKADTT
ncbi:DUF3152 domain-containing protein [Intrasporangium calvum]|uniref:DUF3152 domain-containing protein n=1 Tax=Intrasporangium calvum TaxID=53358 RepID=A0ABT5GMG0_9MICO|nr:DUF3152 domain-containing protein [Intrasporangium calvum]MDC5699075.1 DUF3152 domain-containing protein [Intrasporangium calvum]